MIPSLGIILTEKCNFKCAYCPPFGENMAKTETGLCKLNSLLSVIEIAPKHNIANIRFTGGEPFLLPKRLESLLKKAVDSGYDKIILNTNGFNLVEHIDWLKKYKDHFLLKISLDTLRDETFKEIIRVKNINLSNVIDGIDLAIKEGFNIEINTVANKYNYNELFDLVRYCQKKNLSLKIFELFDFGGAIENFDDIKVDIDSFLNTIHNELESVGRTRLGHNRGVSMHKYKLTNNSHLLIVSHEGANSSEKYYTESCRLCPLYPCNTGKFQIPIRADGLMQSCRIAPDGVIDRINISDLDYMQIESSFIKILQDFNNEFTH